MMLSDIIDKIVDFFVIFGGNALFFNVTFNKAFEIPFLIAWLVVFGFYFLVKFDFISIRHLLSSIKLGFSSKLSKQQSLLPNKYNLSNSKLILLASIGEAIDVSAIFGVAMAIVLAGPGVLFWIFFGCIIGMPLRFAEVALGCMTRKFDAKTNTVRGGPQVYIPMMFRAIGLRKLGIIVAKVFAFCVIISTFFSLQINQTMSVAKYLIPSTANYSFLLSIVLSLGVLLIVGMGFKAVIQVSSILVRLMSVLYILITLVIIFQNIEKIIPVIKLIFNDAFSFKAISGSVLFAAVFGLRRLFFACDIGQGLSSLIHINTINKNSIQEGLLSMSSVFFISIISIFCSGMIVLLTDVYLVSKDPIDIVISAFNTVHPVLKYVLLALIPMFAITTAAAWGYFGRQSWIFLFSTTKFSAIYYLFLFCAYVMSCVTDFGKILDLADIFNLSIAIPNMLALSIGIGFVYSRYQKEKRNMLKI